MTDPSPAAALVLTERHDDGVVVLRLNRPPMNPLSRALLTQLGDAALALATDASVKAVLVLGSEKALAAGADITEFDGPEAAAEIGAIFRRAFDGLAAIPRPVVAGVRGFALGGGMELALACDLRVAAPNARLGQPEILLGIIPGAGGTQRLTRLVGPARARDLSFTARTFTGSDAAAWGLAAASAPREGLDALVQGYIDQILASDEQVLRFLAFGTPASLCLGYVLWGSRKGVLAWLATGLALVLLVPLAWVAVDRLFAVSAWSCSAGPLTRTSASSASISVFGSRRLCRTMNEPVSGVVFTQFFAPAGRSCASTSSKLPSGSSTSSVASITPAGGMPRGPTMPAGLPIHGSRLMPGAGIR